jgi:hypothetical protein
MAASASCPIAGGLVGRPRVDDTISSRLVCGFERPSGVAGTNTGVGARSTLSGVTGMRPLADVAATSRRRDRRSTVVVSAPAPIATTSTSSWYPLIRGQPSSGSNGGETCGRGRRVTVGCQVTYNNAVRSLTVLCFVAGCLKGPAYKLDVTESYEVGEDATIGLHVRELSDDDADIVIRRPDGTDVRQHAPLDVEVTRVRFAPPVPRPRAVPTFTMKGEYIIELRSGSKVLAKRTLEVTLDHLDDLISEESFDGYKPITRFARPKQAGAAHWKTYGATYEHPFHPEARIDVLIEEPKQDLKTAWKAYEEQGTLGVIKGATVLIRERAESARVAWISDDLIISMTAPILADIEKLIGHFIDRYPSKLSAK